MLDYIYNVFGFKYELYLSTRPEQYFGELEMWEKAEESLMSALKSFGKEF